MSRDIQELEQSVEEAKKVIEFGNKVQALMNLPVFREVIGQGYFVDEAARLVHLYSDKENPHLMEDVERDIHAVGCFKQWLKLKVTQAARAESDLEAANYQLEQARVEEVEVTDEVDHDQHYAGSLGA